MTEKDFNSGADSEEVTVETTSVFRADFLNELDAPPAAMAVKSVSSGSELGHLPQQTMGPNW